MRAGIANADTGQNEAMEELGKTLMAIMGHLYPSNDWDELLSIDENWGRLPEFRKAFYRLSLQTFFSMKGSLIIQTIKGSSLSSRVSNEVLKCPTNPSETAMPATRPES